MHLVGFTVEMHYNARSCKRQYCMIVEISVLAFHELLVQCYELADILNVLMWESCRSELKKISPANVRIPVFLNPLNAELNPICHLLVLLGAHHILHVSRIRVNP